MKKHAFMIKAFAAIGIVCLALLTSACNLVADEIADQSADSAPIADEKNTSITTDATEEPVISSEKPVQDEEITEATEKPTEEPKYDPGYPEWIFADIPTLDESKFDPENPSEKYAVVPEGTTELEYGAFYKHTALLGVKLPSTLEKIGERAFSGCTSLKVAIIPEGVTEIKTGAFWECSKLETLYLPSTLTSFGEDVFDACDSLRQVVIPDGVKTLSSHLFFNCKYLNSLALPASVEKLDACCVGYCIRLKNIYFLGTVDQWNSIEKADNWNECTRTFTVFCSDGMIEYKK